MKIKNKRAFITGIITTILFITSVFVYCVYAEDRFIISSILLFALSIVNFIRAFTKKGTLEKLAEHADERDIYIVSKTSYLTIKIITYTLSVLTFMLLLLYGVYKYQYLMIIASTLCAILVLMFFIYLSVNIYLERHE